MKPIRYFLTGAALTMLLALSYSAAQAKNVVENGRSNYSNQLRDYCNDKLNQPKRTCIVVGNKSLKKVEKKYEKMKKMYTQNKKATYDVHFIPEEDFKFVTAYIGEGKENVVQSMPQKRPKAPKDKKKDGKMPPPPKK